MAPSLDRTKHFDLSKQGVWLKYSSEVINEWSHLLSHFPQQKPQVREDIHCPEDVFRTGIGCAYAFFELDYKGSSKTFQEGPC
ncbi:LidE [Legionella feeleii]|uniref:LidE n=1 Tax=Legionella feeleii TaxID=453 RepID=A0A378IPE3_9GAMM|nr:LidE [Legionella feeleii]